MNNCCKCIILSLLNVLLVIFLNQSNLSDSLRNHGKSSLKGKHDPGHELSSKVGLDKLTKLVIWWFQEEFTELMEYRRSEKKRICDQLFSSDKMINQTKVLNIVHYK